jgi:MerR family regulatory protein
LKSLSVISIGELSRQSECHVETIRYYERIGLLPKPRRQGRFRRYGAGDGASPFVAHCRQPPRHSARDAFCEHARPRAAG